MSRFFDECAMFLHLSHTVCYFEKFKDKCNTLRQQENGIPNGTKWNQMDFHVLTYLDLNSVEPNGTKWNHNISTTTLFLFFEFL